MPPEAGEIMTSFLMSGDCCRIRIEFLHDSIRAHIGSRSEELQERFVAGECSIRKLVPFSNPCTRKWNIGGHSNRLPQDAVSRSAFELRFKDIVGETPPEYLTSWRMQKTTGLLQKGDKKLFEVAESMSPIPTLQQSVQANIRCRAHEYRRNANGPLELLPTFRGALLFQTRRSLLPRRAGPHKPSTALGLPCTKPATRVRRLGFASPLGLAACPVAVRAVECRIPTGDRVVLQAERYDTIVDL
jgi:AraC-like DNA-binding protein